MRIGMFTDTYKPQINGVATSIETLADELEELGHEVFIVAQNESMTRYEISERSIRIPGVKLHLMDDKRITNFYPVKVVKKIKSWNLDVIHSHTEFGIGTFARIFAKQNKIPLVHTYHTMYEDYSHYISRNIFLMDRPVKKIIKLLSKFYCNTTTELIVPTDKTKVALIKYGLIKVPHVVPTGINVKHFYNENFPVEYLNTLRNEFGLNEDHFVVLYIGRVSKEKSVDFVIDSFQKVYEYYSNARLLIIGDGPERENLQKYTRKLGISESVIFAGKKPWQEIAAYYQLGDIFVSASRTETQGLTIIEALSASLPVLCYKDESFAQMITEGYNGDFFTQKKQLTKQITDLIENEELFSTMKQNARESVVNFSSEKFAEDVLKVYNIAVENGKIVYGDKKKNILRRVFK